MKDRRCPVESESGRLYLYFVSLLFVVIIIIIIMAIVNNSEMKRFSLSFPLAALSLRHTLSPVVCHQRPPPLPPGRSFPIKKRKLFSQHEIIIIIILRERQFGSIVSHSPSAQLWPSLNMSTG